MPQRVLILFMQFKHNVKEIELKWIVFQTNNK